jgi:hypothetical protein
VGSFTPGSSGGQDGLCPQHLADMINHHVGETLNESLTEFINFVLAGDVLEAVSSTFFEATLLALMKSGDIRPIAAGLTLRRLVAKVACALANITCSPLLAKTAWSGC